MENFEKLRIIIISKEGGKLWRREGYIEEKYLYKELLWWEWLQMVRGNHIERSRTMRGLILKRGLEEQPGRPEAQRVILRLVHGNVFSDIKSLNAKPWIPARHGYADLYSNSVLCCYPMCKRATFGSPSGKFSRTILPSFTFCKFCFHNTPLACRKGQQEHHEERRGLEVLIIKEFRSLH